jgi:hypothetical protein
VVGIIRVGMQVRVSGSAISNDGVLSWELALVAEIACLGAGHSQARNREYGRVRSYRRIVFAVRSLTKCARNRIAVVGRTAALQVY